VVKVACAVIWGGSNSDAAPLPASKNRKAVRTNGVTSVGQTPLTERPTRSGCRERRHPTFSSAWELRKSSCTLYGSISFIPRAALLRSLCEIRDEKNICFHVRFMDQRLFVLLVPMDDHRASIPAAACRRAAASPSLPRKVRSTLRPRICNA
jgi:hypothetical protein